MSKAADFLTARLDEDEAWTRRSTHLMAASDTPAGTTRVLREVEAKRRIVARHPEFGDGTCRDCCEDYPCPTLRILAAVYADHPDYDEEWRP